MLSGAGMQPHASLGYNAQIGLGEHLVPAWPKSEGEKVRGRIVLHRAHARPHNITVGHDDFHPAQIARMLAVGRIADAVVERVADHRAPGVAGNRHPQIGLFALDMFVQIEKADAGFDDAVAELVIEFENLVHAAQIEHNRSRHARRARAIAKVFAARDRPERRLVLVGKADDRLHFFGRGWRDGGRGRPFFFRAGGVDIGIGIAIGIGCHDPILADYASIGFERRVELSRAGTWGEGEFHAGLSSYYIERIVASAETTGATEAAPNFSHSFHSPKRSERFLDRNRPFARTANLRVDRAREAEHCGKTERIVIFVEQIGRFERDGEIFVGFFQVIRRFANV